MTRGNDPLYTQVKVLQNQYNMMRSLYLPYPAQYVEQYAGVTFSALRYLSDSNAPWSAMLAENALGVPVEPAAAPTWTATYAGDGTNRNQFTGACTNCTDTLSTVVLDTAATRAIMVVTLGGGSVTNASCGGVSTDAPHAVSTSAGRTSYVFRLALGSGSNPRTCTITQAEPRSNSGRSQWRR
jgi:hypothetical protein